MSARATPLRTGPAFAAAAVALLLSARPGGAGFVTFESGQVRPLALAPDGSRLFAANTPDGRLEILDVTPAGLVPAGAVAVGLEPVAVAARTDDEVWVVNHLSDSVSIVDVASRPPRVVRTLLVGDEPRDIVFAGPGRARAFVTAAHRGQNGPAPLADLTTAGIGRADVWVFDALDVGPALGGSPLAIVTLFADTPRALAVSPDGGTVYAAGFHTGNETATVSEGAVCNGGAAAPPCTVGGVTMPGGLPAPNTNFQGIPGPETGLVVRFDRGTGHWMDELGRAWDGAVRFDLPDLDVFAIDAFATPPVEVGAWAHVGTVLYDLAVNPVSGKVYATNTEARNEVRFEGPGLFAGRSVRGRLHEARITVLDGAAVLPRHLNEHVDYAVVPSPPGVKERSLALPGALAVSADGSRLYVAAFGSAKVAVLDTAALEAGTLVPSAADHIAVAGGGPSGLALDEPRGRLYVLTRFDDAVVAIDLATHTTVQRVPLFNPEPPHVVAGRPFLYDATRTSSNGEAACAVCHVFGDFDSLAWDLGDPDGAVKPNRNPIRLDDFFNLSFDGFHPMKGPMTTQSLRGLANHGPMHWRGDRTGADVPGGSSLDESASFQQFNVAFDGLLGRGGPIAAADMKAFADFILEVTYPPNPNRPLDGTLTPAQQAGRNHFFGPTSDAFSNCNGCHVTSPADGFFGGDGFTTFEGEPQLFKVPHLRNAYQKLGMFGMPATGFFNAGDNGHKGPQVRGSGFLHDGSFDTVERFLNGLVFNRDFNPFGSNPGGFPTGPAGDALRRNVEQFILAFDTTLAPVVGQQITLDAGAAAAVGSRLDLLVARAAAGDCDLVVKGVVDGEPRGWRRTAAGTFASDFTGEPEVADAVLRVHALEPGQPLTYTCVPPGSGVRVGVDRDEDGAPDRTELDEGTDPANGASRPPIVPWLGVPTDVLALTDGSGAADPSRRSLRFRAATRRLDALATRIVPPPPGGEADPSAHGAVLEVYNAAGLTADRATVALPAAGWSTRPGRAVRYRYRDRRPGAAVTSVVVRVDRVVVKAGGPAFRYSLDEPAQARVAVRLTLGSGARWCAAAPAADDRIDRFTGARGAPAPASCPPAPLR